jgi:hypothetical protein
MYIYIYIYIYIYMLPAIFIVFSEKIGPQFLLSKIGTTLDLKVCIFTRM